MSNKLVTGSKVYCPLFGTGVYTYDFDDDMGYVLITSSGAKDCIDNFFHTFTASKKGIFEATDDNHALLERLHGVKFTPPAPKPTDIVRKLLESQAYVLCATPVDYNATEPRANLSVVVLVKSVNDDGAMVCSGDRTWYGLLPINPTTGEIIKELEL